MIAKSTLLLPPSELSTCLFAAILRDTRGVELSDEDRFNFFPASPLVSVTHVIEGELHMMPFNQNLEAVRSAPPTPRTFIEHPEELPTVSWSPGPVLAVSVGIYPDAWAQLGSGRDVIRMLEEAFSQDAPVRDCWEHFCKRVSPVWRTRIGGGLLGGTGIARISAWSRALLTRAALSGPGRSARSMERRIKRWSGQTRRSLDFYSSFENLHRTWAQSRDKSLAGLAMEAGFADQSHMGRAVRRGTGFSPARLNQLIASKEAFWCYRLLGERY